MEVELVIQTTTTERGPMTNCRVLSKTTETFLVPAEIDMDSLPARLSKRLWVTPAEFLQTTNALQVARWAVRVSLIQRPSLPEPSRRGPKIRYSDENILMLAYIQAAWQMGYERVVDYFRSHPEAAQVAGFANGRVISIGQYWERRHVLDVWTFWLFFVGMVWQLLRAQIIHGVDVVLDSTTQQTWFHGDTPAAWSFPKPWKGSTWGYKVHTLLCRWSELPIMFLVTPANRHDSPLAIPLLSLAVACFGIPIAVVPADAAYFSFTLLHYPHGFEGGLGD